MYVMQIESRVLNLFSFAMEIFRTEGIYTAIDLYDISD